jgi:hypothetical protein
MNRIAIAFSTCDRIELTKRSIEPLLQPGKFDLWWCDGSKTDAGIVLPTKYRTHGDNIHHESNVRGGSGPAIVYALTQLLLKQEIKERRDFYPTQSWERGPTYDYIGLVENDVLLDPDWFEPTMELFKIGKRDGLEVGAVSARCYEDRILIQRDGYAIMHNLGAGMVIFSRKAAEIVLQTYRTVWTSENRLLFAQLSGIDLGSYWAFRGMEHFLVADWRFDMVLASRGLASLALTPNKATMLDQDIEPLGLKYADGTATYGKNAFDIYRDQLECIRFGSLRPGINEPFFRDDQGWTIFPHQVPQLGGEYKGNWHVRDFLGFGPFVWKSGKMIERDTEFERPQLSVPVSGPCALLLSGGATGGQVKIEDGQSGFKAEPGLPPENDGTNIVQVPIPSGCGYRAIKLTALGEGICFLGLKTLQPQPWMPHVKFDYGTLPPPQEAK